MEDNNKSIEKQQLAKPTSPTVQSPRIAELRHESPASNRANPSLSFNRSPSLYSRSMEWQKSGKGRFLFGPTPNNSFGPRAVLSGVPEPYELRDMNNKDKQQAAASLQLEKCYIPDPADVMCYDLTSKDEIIRNLISMLRPNEGMLDPCNQHLEWRSAPQSVLIIKKHLDKDVTRQFKDMVKWLINEKHMFVLVEQNVWDDELTYDEDFNQELKNQIKPFSKERPPVDLVVCMGGDGTLIHVSSLFQGECPPVIAFHLGSLGFMTPFSMTAYKDDIESLMKAQLGLSLRSRLKCQVRRMSDSGNDEVESEHLVLNEVVVDRGTSSSVTHVEIYCNGRFLTTLLGDGLIISTPTGSTAYSMSAGASMVHPSVPGIVLTPICPHSLSFRPIVLPAGVELKIIVSTESRNFTPMCSFDGRNPKEMNKTKYLRVTTSVFPIPCISHEDHLSDWFNSLAECLHWNRRDMIRTASYKRSKDKRASNGSNGQR